MNENEIIGMLGDIRYAMFDILSCNDEKLMQVLNVIDDKMKEYRGMSNKDIAEHLLER